MIVSRRLEGGLVAILLAVASPAFAWDSPAPDVVLYCTPALEAPLRGLAARFAAANGVSVHVLVGSPSGQAGLIRHRARADVLVDDRPIIDALGAEHLLRDGSVIAIGRNRFVLAAQPAVMPAPAPTLVADRTIVVTDATDASGIDGAAVLRTSAPDVKDDKLRGVADTPTVIAELRGDASLLGVLNRTEANTAGLRTVAELAAPPVEIVGALIANGQSRNSGALLAFIAGPDGRSILQHAGLEVTR